MTTKKTLTRYSSSFIFLILVFSNPISLKEVSGENTEENVFLIQSFVLFNQSLSPFEYPTVSYTYTGILGAIGGSLYEKDRIRGDEVSNIIPELAIDFPVISNDRLTYEVTLKPNLKFSNGASLTSDDVVFTYNLFLSPDLFFNADADPIFSRPGYRYSDLITVFDDNSSISKIDDSTIQFNFKEVSVLNFEALKAIPIIPATDENKLKYSNCVSGVIEDCVWDYANEDYFISAGPFMIDKLDQENHVLELVKNPYYPNEIYIDRLIFEGNYGLDTEGAIIENRADHLVMPINYDVFESYEITNDYELRQYNHPNNFWIVLNHLHPYFGTGALIPNGINAESDNDQIQARLLRKALSHAVDRDYYSKEIFGRSVNSSSNPLPTTVIGFKEYLDVYDIDMAKSYMESAGFDYSTIVDSNNDGDYTDSGDTYFFNTSIPAFRGDIVPDRYQFMSRVKEGFAQIGVKLILSNLTAFDLNQIWFDSWINQTLFPLASDGGYDGFAASWTWDIPLKFEGELTSDGFCTASQENSNYCLNLGNYANPTLEAQLFEHSTTDNYTLRFELIQSIQEIIKEETPVINIYNGNSPAVFRQSVARDFDMSYTDAGEFSWQAVRKLDWKLPSDKTEENGRNSQYIMIVSGIAVMIIAVTYIIRGRMNR